jgi:hypothetical protein
MLRNAIGAFTRVFDAPMRRGALLRVRDTMSGRFS